MKKRLIAVFSLFFLCGGLSALDDGFLRLLFRGSFAELRAWADSAGPALNDDIFVDLRPIMLIADRFDPESPEAARAEIASMYEYLIKAGARLDPWSSARVGDLVRLKKQLADDPASKGFVTGTGDPLLCGAVKSGSFECMEFLLGLGLDPDVIDARGATPLMYAARRGDRAMAERLLGAGAGLEARDDDGKTALAYARAAKRAAMAEFLASRGSPE